MNVERTFEAAGKSYSIRFTQNAMYRLEAELAKHIAPRPFIVTQIMLWAGLEGARLKNKSRAIPFTLDEAGDLIDELGGMQAAAAIVEEAFASAFPKKNGGGAETENPTPD